MKTRIKQIFPKRIQMIKMTTLEDSAILLLTIYIQNK